MQCELGGKHHKAHIHALYGDAMKFQGIRIYYDDRDQHKQRIYPNKAFIHSPLTTPEMYTGTFYILSTNYKVHINGIL